MQIERNDIISLSDSELSALISSSEYDEFLKSEADSLRRKYYGTDVYIRGLIEFSNYCKNNCYYCGIRAGNGDLSRYRLTKEDILSCCEEGYSLGFRTFVLQSGEDLYFTDKMICDIVSSIKSLFPDCAVTLSIGEKSRESYEAYFSAGADRYLLRHETADDAHYRLLHPESMSLSVRKKCLYDLKEIGYQVGAGFMVGSPYQTSGSLVSDIRFLTGLEPDMIGIGPYIAHEKTPFASFANGTLELSLRMVALARIFFPTALIPATTALGTIDPIGREKGLCAGANVVMPNLSPTQYRKLYSLYENKICTGEEAAECVECLKRRVASVGYNVVVSRGDKRERTALHR